VDSIFLVPPAPQSQLEHLGGLSNFQDSRVQRLLFADGSEPPPSLDTYVWGFWNLVSLFIFFSGRFLQLRMIPETPPAHASRRTPYLWQKSDVFEIMIGRECARTGRYREFQVAPDGRWLAADIRLEGEHVMTDQEWDGVIHCVSEVDEKKKTWRAGVEIPWVLLGGREGAGEWRCNFYRATGRFHGDELFAWRPTGYGGNCFHRPHLFGDLKILESEGQ
jgi:hypothetical protein